MQRQINISYPVSLANSLKMNEKEFEKEIRMSSLVKLFELGKISSGTAAKVLGISRVDFLESASRYQVSPFGYSTIAEIDNDLANA
ncbi:MAG: UPF0175 family protein [Bacteroidales bacterium]